MSTIEQKVMGNVAAIYAARLLVSFTALKLYALLFSIAGILLFVSIGNVAHNFIHAVSGSGIGSVAVFVLGAISGTTLLVQMALVLGVLASMSLFFDVFRTFSTRLRLA